MPADDAKKHHDDEISGEDVLREFGGDEVVDDPGEVGHEPTEPGETPASDADAPAP